MEEVIFKPVYNESVVLTSIVNGLIATSILWTFWTPFIVFLVVPLVNAQIKQQICESGEYANISIPGKFLDAVWDMQESGKITQAQAEQLAQFVETFYAAQSQTDTANNLIRDDQSEMANLNFNLMTSMGFAASVIVVLCMGLVLWTINKYNLNGPHILVFNLVMALVIMLVEMGFFGLVAMRYIPFDPPKIIESLVQKIVNYMD
jgi:hypothetical protein